MWLVLQESIAVFMSVVLATVGCDMCMEPSFKLCTCHFWYFVGNLLLDFLMRYESGIYIVLQLWNGRGREEVIHIYGVEDEVLV